MIAGTAASTDNCVHEEFVCLYLDDVCEKSNWNMPTIKFRTTSGNQRGSRTQLN